VPTAEDALLAGHVEVAAEAAAEASEPISDVRGSAAYRRAMAAVVTRRAIEVALARARGEDVPVPATGAFGGATS
jgi:carbon-monoxide dehydrogenase medium subunit